MTTTHKGKPDVQEALEPRSGLLATGGLAFLFVWTITLIDGAWAYLFRRLLKTSSPSITLLLIGVLALFVFRALASRRPVALADGSMAWGAWAMSVFLLVAAVVQSNTQNLSVILILFSFYILYFYLLIFPFSVVFANCLSERFVAKYLLAFSVGMALFGVVQAATGNLFAIGNYITGAIQSINTTVGGRVRASALFNHSDDLGIFLCIALAISLHQGLTQRSGRRWLGLIAYAILLAGCAATLTRVVFLEAVVVSACVWWAVRRARGGSDRILPVWLPFLLLAAGISIFFLRYALEAILLSFDFLKPLRFLISSKSLDERMYGITYYFKMLDNAGVVGWLFGLGWTFRSNIKATVPVDNGFVGVLINIGFLGFVFWLWLSFRCWLFINRVASARNIGILVPFAAYFSTWLFLSVFGSYLQPFMVAVLAVCILPAHAVVAAGTGRQYHRPMPTAIVGRI